MTWPSQNITKRFTFRFHSLSYIYGFENFVSGQIPDYDLQLSGDLGGTAKKKTVFFGNFPKRGGRHPNSQNFCKITKSFLACQIHPKGSHQFKKNLFTGPIPISAMGWRLDLCFAIERVWSLLGLAHPGRDPFSR